jgi:Flp pilus assembly protein TadG
MNGNLFVELLNMKPRKCQPQRRTGAIAPLTALLLIPLFGMMAFSIDVGYMVVTQAELQNAADAAALAGAEKLQALYVQYNLPGQSATQQQQIFNTATTNTNTWDSPTYTAEQFASYNKAGGVYISVPDADVTFWYKSGSFSPQPASYPTMFPNTITVVTRRDTKVNGQLSLFFGAILGTGSVSLSATSSATIYVGDVSTLQVIPGVNAHILPVALDLNVWKTFYLTGQSPDGTVHTNATNGMPELHVYPTPWNAPGNFGLLDVGPPANDAPAFRNWINNGDTPNDIQYLLNHNLLPVSSSTDTWWKGGPGLTSTLLTNFQSAEWQPNLIPLFKPYQAPAGNLAYQTNSTYQAANGNGQGGSYDIVGFAGVVVSQATGSGGNMDISIQPAAVIDPTAVVSSPVPATSSATTPLATYMGLTGASFTTFVSAKLSQ